MQLRGVGAKYRRTNRYKKPACRSRRLHLPDSKRQKHRDSVSRGERHDPIAVTVAVPSGIERAVGRV